MTLVLPSILDVLEVLVSKLIVHIAMPTVPLASVYIANYITIGLISFFCSIKFQNLLQLNQYLIEYLV